MIRSPKGISKPAIYTYTSIFPTCRCKKGGMQGLRFSSRFGLRLDLSSARHVGKKEKRATSLGTAPRKRGSSNRSAEGCRLGIWARMRYEDSHTFHPVLFSRSRARRYDSLIRRSLSTTIQRHPVPTLHPFLCSASPVFPSLSVSYRWPFVGKFSITINNRSQGPDGTRETSYRIGNNNHYTKRMEKHVAIFIRDIIDQNCRALSKHCNIAGAIDSRIEQCDGRRL